MDNEEVYVGTVEIPINLNELKGDPSNENKAVVYDDVKHPKHYNRDGAFECIEEMIMIFGREAVMYFCLLNAWKYRYRSADKNGYKDLRKSDWYLHEYKRLKFEIDRNIAPIQV